MARIPFGVSRLDSLIGGGAPAGSVVLLAGEAGAGAREFLYTSAVITGLAKSSPDLFDLHYGGLDDAATLPDEIHYVSVTGTEGDLHNEISHVMDDDIVDAGLGAVTFSNFSSEYFHLSPVPREWYTGQHRSLTELGESEPPTDVIVALAEYLDRNAPGNLLLIDSLTDLITVRRDGTLEWSDIIYFLKGLCRVSHHWQGLLMLHVSSEALTEQELGALMMSVDGTLVFDWATGGNERSRSMVVREFRGILSQLEEEDIVRFETELHDAGFDISDVRKIR